MFSHHRLLILSDKTLACIEVPKSTFFLTEIDTEVYEVAQRQRITLVHRQTVENGRWCGSRPMSAYLLAIGGQPRPDTARKNRNTYAAHKSRFHQAMFAYHSPQVCFHL